MDKNSDLFENFEHLLNQHNSKRPSKLYSIISDKDANSLIKVDYNQKDIIRNVSAQIKAMQNADCVNSKCVNKTLEKHKTSSFVSLNKLQTPVAQHIKAAKFETQFVLDTQFINIIEDVEAMNSHKGITQEFDTSFDHTNVEQVNNRVKPIENNVEKCLMSKNSNSSGEKVKFTKDSGRESDNNDCLIDNSRDVSEYQGMKIITGTECELSNNKIPMDDICTALLDKCIEIEENINIRDLITDTEINPSPVIHIHKENKSKSTSPLVYNLDCFEKFEKFAIPIVEQNNDIDTVKHLINSQILGKELSIQIDLEPEYRQIEEQLSPVLKISKTLKIITDKPDLTKKSTSNIKITESDKHQVDFTEKYDNEQENKLEIFNSTNLTGAEQQKEDIVKPEISCLNFEDEILFSSDEEYDVKQTDLKDLPFTCALETSFYEHSDVLDTTMYVGFQTASNKSIQISTVSFTKAKSILDKEADGIQVPTLKQLVEKCDSLNTKTVVNDNCALNKDDQIKTEEIDFDSIVTSDVKFVGFKAANGKSIEISDKNMDKAKFLFEHIDNDDTIKNLSQSCSKFDGFKTASNKNIILSEKSLKRCKRVFQDIDFDEHLCDDNLLSETEPSTKRIKYSLDNTKGTNDVIATKGKDILYDEHIPKIDEDILQEFEGEMSFNDNIIDNKDNNFVGFKTASEKSILISDIALVKSRNILESIDDFNEIPDKNIGDVISYNKRKEDQNFCSKHVGFKTASNQIISISDEALAKTKSLFQDIVDFSNVETISDRANQRAFGKDSLDKNDKTDVTSLIRFKTASNKKIEVSGDAYTTTKHIFQDIQNNEAVDNFENIDLIAGNIDLNKPSTSKEIFFGFKTANNKKITVSAEALAKSKTIFQDFDDIHANMIQNDNNFTEEIDAAKLIQDKNLSEEFDNDFKPLSDKENREERSKNELLGAENNVDKNEFKGFQTANNELVKMSNEAIKKSKIIFQDILVDGDLPKDGFIGFQTASNKKIQISDSALERSKIILADLDEEQDKFHGFQTASNKEVKVSAQALATSRRVLENLDKVNDESNKNENLSPKHVFSGFQTASNKEVKISTDALARSRKLFEVLEAVAEDSNLPKIESSTSNLQITERKETATKENVLEDQNNSPRPIIMGFQTASNKKVTISNEALTKSKMLFKELERELENEANINNFSHETECDKISAGFRGFQTAGNKEVKISAEALAKSKKIFQDLSNFKENDFNILEKNKQTDDLGLKTTSRQILSDVKFNNTKQVFPNPKPAFGFKTANNNDIQISEEALSKSRQLFTELVQTEEEIQNSGIIKLHDKEIKLDVNIDKLIDTQVINNFDESLNTEDFKSPKDKSKRSGSPILSCPKAKKRKFSTPYRKENFEYTKEALIKEIEIYDDSYKKHKKYTLKDIEKLENCNTGTEITTNIDVDDINLDTFEFVGKRNDISESNLSLDVLKNDFLKSVNKKLIPDGWFENHVQLILWKLLSYEIRFPKTMLGICTAKNVLAQLKYRYYKELYNAERPALRKILEKDDVPSKSLVLCIRDVIKNGDENSGTNLTELLLTDGWYNIRTCIDKMLIKYMNEGKIKIGTKIITHGAELLNCEQGIAPWEDTSSVRLKIYGNSTRRVLWHTRLGYHSNAAILSHLSSVKPEGGKVGKLRAIVARVYPMMYVEKFADGSTVTRSERLEHIHQMKYEADRQAIVEKIYEEVEKEMSDEESPDAEDMDISKRSLDSGSQIARLLKMSKEPSQFRSNLTDSQRRLLDNYMASKRDKVLQDIQDRIQSKLATTSRNVVPLLKIRIVELYNGKIDKALLTIWKPNDAIMELITEGACIDLLNVVPTAVRYSELQLSAGRQTIFKQNIKQQQKLLPHIKSVIRTCYPIKEIVTHPCMVTDYNEIDTIGMVIQIDPNHKDFKSINQFQNVYLTDEERNIISVNFWGGIKKFGFENVLDTGQVVACVNLQKRAGNTRKNIPQYRATEFTYFTKTPKNVDARKLIEDFSKKVSNHKVFIEECVNVKNNMLKLNISNENISPYRIQNHDLSKNKVYIESPLARISKVDEFNLSGLDFESTFRQTEPQELSPKSLLRKKKVQDRISKLKMYGEPPPLSPINIINKSINAIKSFKSPLLNSSAASKSDPVASVKKLPENTGELLNCSPVLSVNRTLKKGVNPVKLNFNSVAIEENDSVDHFAEEFDSSPPLSLD